MHVDSERQSLAVSRSKTAQASDVVSVTDMSTVQSKYIPGWVSPPPAEQADFLLQQISPSTTERKLSQKAILFGRVEKVCDVVIVHASASRVHAVVAFDETGTLQLADLGSTHGKNSIVVLLRRMLIVVPIHLWHRGADEEHALTNIKIINITRVSCCGL